MHNNKIYTIDELVMKTRDELGDIYVELVQTGYLSIFDLLDEVDEFENNSELIKEIIKAQKERANNS